MSEEVLHSFLSEIFNSHKKLTTKNKNDLVKLTDLLISLSPVIQESERLKLLLFDMIEYTAFSMKSEKLPVKILNTFYIKYSPPLVGPNKITFRFNKRLSKRNMRLTPVKGHVSVINNPSLLIGELFQKYSAKILKRLMIEQSSVIEVTSMKINKNQKGSRVDDWLIILDNGKRIPVEVKCSKSIQYFYRAFNQIQATLKEYDSVLFMGLVYTKSLIIITKVNINITYAIFKNTLKKLSA